MTSELRRWHTDRYMTVSTLSAHRDGAVGSSRDEAVWAARLQAAHGQECRHSALVYAGQLGVNLRQ